jgi:hypothetical protein
LLQLGQQLPAQRATPLPSLLAPTGGRQLNALGPPHVSLLGMLGPPQAGALAGRVTDWPAKVLDFNALPGSALRASDASKRKR